MFYFCNQPCAVYPLYALLLAELDLPHTLPGTLLSASPPPSLYPLCLLPISPVCCTCPFSLVPQLSSLRCPFPIEFSPSAASPPALCRPQTSSAVLQEIRVAIADVYDTTRALSELAALVPAGAQLFGVGTGESLMLAAAAARAEEGGGGGGGEGEMMEVQQRLEWERERRRREGVSVADLPSVEQLLTAGLAGIVGEGGGMGGGGEGEVQARVAEVVGRCRKVEALWRAEMSGLQEEMGFYRGCHAAQASHVKQIASAAKDALQTVLGDAHEIVSAAATSIQKRRLQILLAVTDFESEPTPEMMQQLAVKVKEEAGTLRRFAELLPQAFSAEAKVAEVLDPLEREFKERMQAKVAEVFDPLECKFKERMQVRRGVQCSKEGTGLVGGDVTKARRVRGEERGGKVE
ncbi:unnamed protein product [Closterium sp. Naga37s-1]|nr:unnamed protein product [Closterium sp. Naga37s-1]